MRHERFSSQRGEFYSHPCPELVSGHGLCTIRVSRILGLKDCWMDVAIGDVVNDERVRIKMAHLCALVCNAAERICFSHAAFKPGLLLVSGCTFVALVLILRTVVCLLR